MNNFLYEVSAEKAKELSDARFADNAKVCNYLHRLIKKNDDRRFNFTILNLGEVMKISAIEINLKQDEIQKNLKLEKEQIRDRRMSTIVKELNEKLNMRFDFEEDVKIVKCLYTYNGIGHIFIDKMGFCDLLDKTNISIEHLEKI